MRHFIRRGGRTSASALIRSGILVLFSLWVAGPSVAQSDENAVVDAVESALTRGDATSLLRHAADRIEIAVLGTSTLYSRAQATYVLEDFFREYPPVRFNAEKPPATRGNFFVAGRYWYGSEDRYLDLYMRFRSRDGACKVRELRIERPVR